MKQHEGSVRVELKELEARLENLTALLTDQPRIKHLGIPEHEQLRLRRQWHYMSLYAGVLRERIADFEGD